MIEAIETEEKRPRFSKTPFGRFEKKMDAKCIVGGRMGVWRKMAV
jgi:hypothetical protein